MKLFKHKNGIFGKHFVKDFYWRIEVQQRGSLHLHGLFWLTDFPIFDSNNLDNQDEIIKLVDLYSTTNIDLINDEELINYQTHNHKRTCKVMFEDEVKCRFNFPKSPMKNTAISYPLELSFSKSEKVKLKENWKRINEFLTVMDKESEYLKINDFEYFLLQLNMSYEEYILSIRSSLKYETIFLQRKISHVHINAFKTDILQLHQANHDIQLILNPYALCNYLVNHVQKSMKGISDVLEGVMEEIKLGNYSIKQKLLKINSKFVNGVEVSAQEAAYTLLGLHMTESSVGHVFINTFPEKQKS